MHTTLNLFLAAFLLVTFGGCFGSACRDGEKRCDGKCLDLQSDPDNCGGCGAICDGEQVCNLGGCADGCSDGLAACDRACVDLQSDPRNCGACGNACAAEQQCKRGSCVGAKKPDGGEPDGGSDVIAPPVCNERVGITASGTLDLNIDVVELSGRLTKNGAAVRSSIYGRGHIEFAGRAGDRLRMKEFADSGEATYKGEIAVGTYDVYYVPPATCESDESPLPCQQVKLESQLKVSASGTLDLNIDAVVLSGRLTKNGQEVPSSSYGRGRIQLQNDDGLLTMQAFDATGAATYQGEVAVGTYHVYWNPGTCKIGESPLPCQQVKLKSAVKVTASGTLDLDMKVVVLSGRLTKNGQTVPSVSSYGRGEIQLVSEEAGTLQMKAFDFSGEATYKGEIAVGTYDLFWSPGTCKLGSSALPCQHVKLKSGVKVTASGTLDLDMKVVVLSGRLTRNSKAVPSGNQSRGGIQFESEASGQLKTEDFGSAGEATYQTEIVAGTYDVFYAPLTGCRSDESPLPCQRVKLKSGVKVTASGTLDLNIDVVQLSGRLTKNGTTVPDSDDDRGRIELENDEEARLRMADFDAAGEATYKGEVAVGSYDLYYVPPSSCRSEDAALPCQRVELKSGISLTTSGTLDLNLDVIKLSGRLTKNNKALPDSDSRRGRLELTAEQATTARMEDFESYGEATYQGELAVGKYDVYYMPPSNCTPDNSPLPCQHLLLKGCPPVAQK